MRIAIVTGASSGLGREFVRQISEREKSDEIWIIARRENRLQKIAEECPLPVRSLPLDLTKDSAFDSLKALLEEEQPDDLAKWEIIRRYPFRTATICWI